MSVKEPKVILLNFFFFFLEEGSFKSMVNIL